MKDGDINRTIYNKKVMIIDECLAFRDIISTICSHWGASPVSADTNRDLVFQAINEMPDLIIIHPGSERRSAFFACKLLKTHDKTRHIPILLTTGDHTVPDNLNESNINFDDYILKPFVPEDLVEKMEKLLNLVVNI